INQLLHRKARCLGESLQLSDHAHSDVLADELGLLLASEAREQMHQRLYLQTRSVPVVDAEGVKSEIRKAHLRRCFQRGAHGFSAGRVTIPAYSAASASPAPVSVHDDCHMVREGQNGPLS